MSTPPKPLTERAEQHIAMLAEMADLTMVLCEVAAARAAKQLAAPATPQDAHDAQDAQNAVLDFTRLAASLRQTIALEARIAAGPPSPAANPAAAPRPNHANVHGTDQREPTTRSPRERTAFTPERSDTAHLNRLAADDPAIPGIIAKLQARLGAHPSAHPGTHPGKQPAPPQAATGQTSRTIPHHNANSPRTPRHSAPNRQPASRTSAAGPPCPRHRRQHAAKL